MRVNIGPIRRNPSEAVVIDFRIDAPERVIDQLQFVPGTPLCVSGTVTNTGDGYLVSGTITAEINLTCGRCLTDYRWPLETRLLERFRPGRENERSPEDDVFADASEDEDPVDGLHYFQGDYIDLSDCVRQQILVSLPMKRLCREDCAGLCPTCGANLAHETCSCTQETVDIRLAPLAEWLAAHKGEANENDES